MSSQKPVAPRQVAAFQSLRPVTVDAAATCGAQIGVNLLLPDGTLGTLATLRSLFGATGTSSASGTAIDTTDDLEEGQFHYWFTDRRAQDAVGGLLADTATITLTYAADTSITATLKDLADSGSGAALVKLTRDSKGRISGTSSASTTDLAEGANLYYTDTRADARIAAQKGLANGLAPLGSDGKLDTAYLPAAVLGQVSYQGTWDASAGTPPTSTPSKGWYYIVTVAGSTSLSGITDWAVGDWAIYNGASWDKIDNTDAIASWNGRTGAVVPQAGDYTFAMLGSTPTTLAGYGITDALQDAPSDGQQYARKDGGWVVVAGGGGSGDVVGPSSSADGNVALFDGTTGKLLKDAGGSFAALVRAAVLTGLSTATSAVIAVTDTVLAALGKLQAQITDNLLPKGYIDGLRPTFVSATAVTIKSGACYIPGAGKVVRNDSDIALTGLSPGASTWAHLYGYESSGVLAAELSTTAPAAPYNGTARCKTGDTSRRYLGSVLTDASGNIYKWLNDGDAVLWENSIADAPFLVIATGRATTATNIACAGCVPVTARVGIVIMATTGSADAAIGNSEMTGSLSSTAYLQYVGSGVQTTHFMPLDSSQRFSYRMTATITAGGFYARVCGFILER